MTALCNYLVLLVLAQIKTSQFIPVSITRGKGIETVEGEEPRARVPRMLRLRWQAEKALAGHGAHQAVPLCPWAQAAWSLRPINSQILQVIIICHPHQWGTCGPRSALPLLKWQLTKEPIHVLSMWRMLWFNSLSSMPTPIRKSKTSEACLPWNKHRFSFAKGSRPHSGIQSFTTTEAINSKATKPSRKGLCSLYQRYVVGT